MESGVLLNPNVSVPPFLVDGLTTLVTAALKPAELDELVLGLLLPPPQAARPIAATAPTALSPMILRLFMR
jgi:hypothetical protein